MADKSFIVKQGDGDKARNVGISHKIRQIGFPVAVVLCLLLLIICIVLAVLYSKEVSKTRVVTPTETKYETCDEERCFRIAMELVKSMDKKADPCKDFYAYACQGWQTKHPLKNGSTEAISRVPLMGKDDLTALKKALETPKANYSKNAAVLKTLRFYDSCINNTPVNALGLQTLKDLVQEYGGWSVSSNIDPSVSLSTRIGKVLRGLNVPTLFDIELLKPNIGLNSAFYSEKNISSKEHLAYTRLLKTVGRVFTGSNSADDKMMAIYDFEMNIAKIFRDRDDTTSRRITSFASRKIRQRRSSSSSYQQRQVSLLSFCNATGIPWPFLQRMLNIIFARDFSGNENISFPYYSNAIKSSKNLYLLIQKTNESVVTDYIMWQVIEKYGKAIPALYSYYQNAFNETKKTPRWKQCINYMSSPFDMTLGLLYINYVIKNNAKQKLEVMFQNIRSSFIERLKTDIWMDSRTKENAKQKALEMKGDIAYPSYIKNASELEKRYESLNITDNFFANFKAISHLNAIRKFDSYDLPVKKSEWELTSLYEVNAFYIGRNNKIVVPAAIMQPPFYSQDYPMYLVYGGIGMVIAHEITHGFDGNGRKYNSDGKKEDWWSKSSVESFEQRSKCLEAQYDKYTVFGKTLNGSLTLDENISDNGGIRFAYEAYQRWTKENGVEKILPGLSLNPDQLFFLGFAQMWCGSYSKESAEKYMEEDPVHSFPKYRVIGPLSNFKRFSEAFNCPANSPMNPSTKCVVW